MNRGSAGGQARLLGLDHASMRPRFMNRGSGKTIHEWPALTLASMRPRFMNRGSQHGRGDLALRRDRFNEAPIHESGKCVGPAANRVHQPGLQ